MCCSCQSDLFSRQIWSCHLPSFSRFISGPNINYVLGKQALYNSLPLYFFVPLHSSLLKFYFFPKHPHPSSVSVFLIVPLPEMPRGLSPITAPLGTPIGCSQENQAFLLFSSSTLGISPTQVLGNCRVQFAQQIWALKSKKRNTTGLGSAKPLIFPPWDIKRKQQTKTKKTRVL